MKNYKLTYKTRDGHKEYELFEKGFDFNSSTELKKFWEDQYPATTIVRIELVNGNKSW